MKILTGGCRVYSADDGQPSTFGNWTARTVISQNSGARRITLTVSEYTPGLSPAVVNPKAEEVLYVVSGEGKCHINGFEYALRTGTAIFVFPGAIHNIENSGGEMLRLVSSCCPEDPHRHIVDGPLRTASGEPPRLTVHEDDREDIRATQDRVFRYLVNTELGCKEITQFAGWIAPSKAPTHYHTMKRVSSSSKATGPYTPTTGPVNSDLAVAFTSPWAYATAWKTTGRPSSSCWAHSIRRVVRAKHMNRAMPRNSFSVVNVVEGAAA